MTENVLPQIQYAQLLGCQIEFKSDHTSQETGYRYWSKGDTGVLEGVCLRDEVCYVICTDRHGDPHELAIADVEQQIEILQ